MAENETQIDEETAQAALEALEQAAVDGEAVTPAQLAEARERVTLAGLWRKGQEQRAERALLKAKTEAQAAAKEKATKVAARRGTAIKTATTAVAAALGALEQAVKDENQIIRKIADEYEAVELTEGFAEMIGGHVGHIAEVDGADPDYHAIYDQSHGLRGVVVAGETFWMENHGHIFKQTIAPHAPTLKLRHAIKSS